MSRVLIRAGYACAPVALLGTVALIAVPAAAAAYALDFHDANGPTAVALDRVFGAMVTVNGHSEPIQRLGIAGRGELREQRDIAATRLDARRGLTAPRPHHVAAALETNWSRCQRARATGTTAADPSHSPRGKAPARELGLPY